jgi:hypothetical protein
MIDDQDIRIVPEPQLSALWVGRNDSNTLVSIVMETPGTRITLDAAQAEHLAGLLLHHAWEIREREIAESN